jgi:hypothetical protein
MNRIHYTKPEIEAILSVVNFVDIEEDVFIGKWKKKTTKELTFQINKSEATINRAFKSALIKVKDAYDRNLIKF